MNPVEDFGNGEPRAHSDPDLIGQEQLQLSIGLGTSSTRQLFRAFPKSPFDIIRLAQSRVMILCWVLTRLGPGTGEEGGKYIRC